MEHHIKLHARIQFTTVPSEYKNIQSWEVVNVYIYGSRL